jgi:hypothetical protein
MKEFVRRYEDRIHGVLSCFDRMLFRGYLPIMSGWQMAQFFNSRNIRFKGSTTFCSTAAPARRRSSRSILRRCIHGWIPDRDHGRIRTGRHRRTEKPD